MCVDVGQINGHKASPVLRVVSLLRPVSSGLGLGRRQERDCPISCTRGSAGISLERADKGEGRISQL